jgi:hypothetical protein
VSIVCLDLKKALPLTDGDVAKFGDISKLKAFAHGVLYAQAFNHGVSKGMPADIVDAVLHVPEFFGIGRAGLRPITSSWVKTHYPDAKYEVVFTLFAHDGSAVHTLLMYFP